MCALSIKISSQRIWIQLMLTYSLSFLPELIESAVYLYQATRDPFLLEIGIDMLEAIEHSTKTKCGYATVSNFSLWVDIKGEGQKNIELWLSSSNEFIDNTGFTLTFYSTPRREIEKKRFYIL